MQTKPYPTPLPPRFEAAYFFADILELVTPSAVHFSLRGKYTTMGAVLVGLHCLQLVVVGSAFISNAF